MANRCRRSFPSPQHARHPRLSGDCRRTSRRVAELRPPYPAIGPLLARWDFRVLEHFRHGKRITASVVKPEEVDVAVMSMVIVMKEKRPVSAIRKSPTCAVFQQKPFAFASLSRIRHLPRRPIEQPCNSRRENIPTGNHCSDFRLRKNPALPQQQRKCNQQRSFHKQRSGQGVQSPPLAE